MAGEWPNTVLGKLIDDGEAHLQTGPFGTALKAAEYSTEGVPVISVGEVRVGHFEISENTPRVSIETTRRLPKFVLETGDIVFGRKGGIDRNAIVHPKEQGWFLGSDGIRLRLSNKYDSLFFSYQMRCPATRAWLIQNCLGTTMPSLNQEILGRVPITLPPLPVQKSIASVLGSLDDKIELNRRMSATLEQMARALFQSWLLDNQGIVQEMRVSDLIDMGILIIGDGYRAKNSEFAPGGLPFVRVGDLKDDGLDLLGAEVLSAQSVCAAGNKVSIVGDVAFTSKGTIGRIARVSNRTGSFVYSPQVCFWRSVNPIEINPSILHRWMRSDDFVRQVNEVSAQTDMAPYVSLKDQRNMIISLPPPTAQLQVSNQLETIDSMLAETADQSRTLANLRDTLLPKLLSGELTIPQDERMTQ